MAQRGGQGFDGGRADGVGEIDLRALGRGVWRRRLWILGPTLCAAVAALVFVQLSSPYYRSTAMVLIENRDGAAPRSGPEREAPLPDEQAVVSQVQLIQSRDLVRTVVSNVGLAREPEFASPDFSFLDKLLHLVGLGGSADMPLNERVVDKVAKNLTVYPVTGSRVIGIEFESVDADLAARTVNAFVDAYLDIQRGTKRETNKQASQYLSDEIESLRGRVADAEERVEAFRSKAGLFVGSNNTTVVAQQLGDASNQLAAVRTQQADAQAKSDMIRTVLRQGRPSEALEIANSELVRQLAQQRSQLAAQIASEGRTLLPQHPRMRELSAQLSGLDDQIKREAEKLAKAFENDAKTAGARVAGLTKLLDSLKSNAAEANGQDVQLRALERDARSQRDLLEQLLTRYREASARDNPEALLADARVISRGAAATEPYFPKKGPTIILVSIAAFVLSLFSAAAAEVFSGSASRPADEGLATPPPPVRDEPVKVAERQGAPAYAAPPPPRQPPAEPPAPLEERVRAAAARPPVEERAPSEPARPAETPRQAAPQPRPVTEFVASIPPAAAAAAASIVAAIKPAPAAPAEKTPPLQPEAAAPRPMRAPIECADATLLSALARQLAAMPNGVGALKILTTGATSDRGVADVAAQLASTISESGRRVVAIDAGGGASWSDDHPREPGLAELLTGQATFAQAIHRDRGARVHIVPRGGRSFAELDSAAKERLGAVLEALALTYDFVMLTTPSGPGGADAFARHCSAAVLITEAGAVDPTTVEAHERLRETGIDDVVVLLVEGGGGGSPRGKSMAA